MGRDLEARIRNVTAVLGPTNTGKTHLAIERMLGHESGMIGLPLRLLAREVYDKIAGRVGADNVALITGEEKIKPERARFWVATVEAMPRDVDVDFLAIDEVQLAGDPERGHVFTDRLLHARGRAETLFLGAQTMRDAIQDLIPGANFISRPRLSRLTYAGEKKITRLPARSAVVAFSANDVYSIAELIRRQRGGTAVVLGALSPRTRNAQVALYQSGDVDFIVATDAIGMGLNLDVDHVAFSALRKFDGHSHRHLTPGELGQIAGRAGRHMNDGTFGVTGGAEPLEQDVIDRLEQHSFDSVRVLQWRNRSLDFGSLDRLRDSLRAMPGEARLTRARMADDVEALETVSADREVRDLAASPSAVTRLWEVCQVPDYRKISSQSHAELVATLYKYLMQGEGRVPEDWFAKQVAFAKRTDGDIDTLANRIAHIRTWTFVSNRPDWLADPQHWQGETRAIEDSLSDALHECLTQRFVDKKTSALMKGLRDKEELSAEIADDGAIHVESHYVGRISGFSFAPAPQGEGIHGRAARNAAMQVLSRELGMRARRVAAAASDAFKLTRHGRVLWRGEEVARLEPADDPLKPQLVLIADESLSLPDREKIQARLDGWLAEHVREKLKPLVDIAGAADVSGLARGIAFRLVESLGVLRRDAVADELRQLDQEARAQLRKYGARFGAFNIFFPMLLKPAPAELALTLWSLKHAGAHGLSQAALPEPPRAGLTSVAADAATPAAFYRAYGFHVCGPRAVRLDILERLADLIRPLVAWRPGGAVATAPNGATGDGGFTATPEMMSILGCSPDELGHVLKALGFRLERRPAPAATPTSAAPADASVTVASVGEQPSPPVADATDAVIAEAAPLASEAAVEAAEAVAGAAPQAPASAEAAQWIEIWRPRRNRHEGERQSADGRRRGRRGDGRGERSGQDRGRRDTPRVPAAAPGEATPEAVTAGAGAAAASPAPPEASRPSRPNEHGGKRQGGERHRDRDRGRGRGDEGSRRDRRGPEQRRRKEERPQSFALAASPPKRAGVVDPDSPFASLGALREALEQRAREKGSS